MKNIVNTVNNVPEYANHYEWWVANRVDGELWFWGAWSDRDRANEVALELGAVVVHNG